MGYSLGGCVSELKCRKGAASGTTKRGAFWLACEPLVLRKCGGDGIGGSGPDVTYTLELRHYRDGDVQAMIHRCSWHQNNGEYNGFVSCQQLLPLKTVEDVICALKGERFTLDNDYDVSDHVWSDYYTDSLTTALTDIGLSESDPAPDEA
jgi:hypothetical protein